MLVLDFIIDFNQKIVFVNKTNTICIQSRKEQTIEGVLKMMRNSASRKSEIAKNSKCAKPQILKATLSPQVKRTINIAF